MIPFLSFTGTNKAIKSELLSVFEKFIASHSYELSELYQHLKTNRENKLRLLMTCVGSGLDAQYIMLKALHIEPENKVIVPFNTCIAAVVAISSIKTTPDLWNQIWILMI